MQRGSVDESESLQHKNDNRRPGSDGQRCRT
jgi:hypothetical protein